jgi:hypothetical protein
MGMKRLLRVEWDAIAGIVAALVALIMHFLHILELNVLLMIFVVLMALLFIRDLRREHFTERIDTSLERLEAAIKALQANLAPPDAILVGPRQLRTVTESFSTRAGGEMIWFHVCLLMFKPQPLFNTLLRPAIENPMGTSIQFILDQTQQELWQQEALPKVDACPGKAKVQEPHWTTIRENVSLILSNTGPGGSTECLMSFWGEPFIAYHTGREVPRYIFHIQSHSELVPRLLELARHYRIATEGSRPA